MNDSVDWVARGIAIAGLIVAVLSFGFNVFKEWLRGRRIRVEMRQAAEDVVVEAYNAGNTPEAVTDWGYRVRVGRGRKFRIEPPDTGKSGPDELPITLAGGERTLFSYPHATLVADVRRADPLASTASVRGFVTLSGRKRRCSKRTVLVIGH